MHSYHELRPSEEAGEGGEVTYTGTVLSDSEDEGRPFPYPAITLPPDQDDVPIIDLDGPSSATQKKPNLYVRLLVSLPGSILMLFCILIIFGCCACASWHYHHPPDFDDPTEGFETRGTEIRAREWTLENLWDNHVKGQTSLIPNRTLALKVFGINDTDTGSSLINWIAGFADKGSGNREKRDVLKFRNYGNGTSTPNKTTVNEENNHPREMIDATAIHCTSGSIDEAADKFVFESTDGSDLFTASSLRSICNIEDLYIAPVLKGQHGCRLRSLSFYVAGLRGKGCQQLTDDDVSETKALLKKCSQYYYRSNNTLKEGYTPSEERTTDIPRKCRDGYFVYRIFYYLTPIGYMKPGSTNIRKEDVLTVTLAYIDTPIFDGESFYNDNLKGHRIAEGNVVISAVNFRNHQSVKYDVFNDYMLEDMVYFILAAVLVTLIMAVYLWSIVLMLATIINVAMSFVLAYFIYFFVFRMTFFPFMNILAALVLIAVGADDVFIFYDCWEKAKEEVAGSGRKAREQAMGKAFSHAALSVFVTSLTTASAFFANFVSHITAIRCFGLFAGLAILCNFVLMVTWTPAVIVVIDITWNWIKRFFDHTSSWAYVMSVYTALAKKSGYIFGKVFPTLIVKGWYVWIALFTLLGVGGCVVVFVKPGLQLPATSDFQLFPSDNLLEAWDLRFTESFQDLVDQDTRTKSDRVPLYFIFGFQAVDDGNWLDPDKKGGPPRRDEAFDFYSDESQMFLTEFCHKVKNSSFVDDYFRGTRCGLESYVKTTENYCSDPLRASVLGPCCKQRTPPFSREQLMKCTPGLELIAQHFHKYGIVGHPIFDPSNTVIGYKMNIQTKCKFSMSYEVMDDCYKEIKSFFNDALKQAPAGMKTGFFSARYEFTFYDLQDSLSKGTFYSIALSLGVAFVVMLVTSGNILITLYAIVTIAFSIICTVAAIVLLGWDLGILESVTISLAVGLSIDFTIHYGVAYTLSKAELPAARVTESFQRVGMAVAMAALTTFLAGASMMPSHILAYIKLGVFLMLVMSFSWIYATFFFQSVCRIIGPKGNFCQVSRACCKSKCRRRGVDDNADQHSLASIDSNDSFLITF